MMTWAGQEKPLVTSEGAFLWVQNHPHLRLSPHESEITECKVYVSAAPDSGCVAEGTMKLTDFRKGAFCHPFGGEVSFREALQH